MTMITAAPLNEIADNGHQFKPPEIMPATLAAGTPEQRILAIGQTEHKRTDKTSDNGSKHISPLFSYFHYKRERKNCKKAEKDQMKIKRLQILMKKRTFIRICLKIVKFEEKQEMR
nr:hypothetical protein [Macrococcus carouselicus]